MVETIMRISEKGLEIIKEHEGLRLMPYLCPAGVPTIGYGNTYYNDGRPVRLGDDKITIEDAELLLIATLDHYERGVNRYVIKEINQCQFDALVSFAYNLGLGALQKSTLLRRINEDPCNPNIRSQFNRWVNAAGRELPGLVKRRKAEADLYFQTQ